MLVAILLAINITVCIALVAVVLLQRSEGGALGMGGGPSGFMTARGAGNLLTQITWILAAVFFALSLILTLLSGGGASSSVTDRMKVDPLDLQSLKKSAPAAPEAPSGQPAEPAGPAPGPSAPPSLDNPFGLPAAPAPSK